MAQKQQEIGRQEGSRWINRRPGGDEFAKWFQENVQMHAGLLHRDYLPGITLIPNKEKVKDVVLGSDGNPRITDVEQLVYAPYPKVETRIRYFWDLMALHPEWRGSIKVIPTEPLKTLPPGCFQMPVPDATGTKMTLLLGASYQVEIMQRGRRGEPVIEPAFGTKMVPLLKRSFSGVYYPDPDAVHKVQTGGQGRALGYAGMLVVPGAGIATAEDMQEFIAEEPPPALPPVEEPIPTENGKTPAGLPELVATLRTKLESEFPKAYEEARAWATEKGFELENPPEAALRGLEVQLRRKLESAQKASAARGA